MICIYSIKNKKNNKVYVGQTINFIRRKRQHLTMLRKGNHVIKQLQIDFNNYGENEFEFTPIIECKKEDLDFLEKIYIKELNAFSDNGGYNLDTGGKKGYKLSKTSKEVMSKITKERFKNDKEYYDKIAKHNKELWLDEEHRKKRIENLRASFTDERRAQMSKIAKESWTDDRKKEKSKQMQEKYSDPNERKKQSEIVKQAMSNLPKEKLSRRHTSKLPIETLIEMTKERHLTQPKMAEKYNTSVATAKSIKSGTHWIYDHMRENNIPIMEIPKEQKFRCSVSTEVLLQIVKDKELKPRELKIKYPDVSTKIINQIRKEEHWIYEYIKTNNIFI